MAPSRSSSTLDAGYVPGRERGTSDIGPAEPESVPHLGAHLGAQLEGLLRLYRPDNNAAGRIRRIFALFTKDSLDRPAVPPFTGLSYINADGLPFQWVLRLDQGGGWGFLCETGPIGAAPAARLGHTLGLIEQGCIAAHGHAPLFLDRAAALLAPPAGELWPAHLRSAAWVGVALKGNALRIKPYFNLNWGNCRDRWLRAGWILKELARPAALARLCTLSEHCSQDSWPAGLALDIEPDGSTGRVKIYFRSLPTTLGWLARWYNAAGLGREAESVRRFLDLFGPAGNAFGNRYPASAFVISLEVHADESLSLKTDLAITKWNIADAAVAEHARTLLASSNEAADQLTEACRSIGAWPLSTQAASVIRFVGLGSEPDGGRHLNVYIEPPLTPADVPAASVRTSGLAAVVRAVRRGLHALIEAREGDHWLDFALPVGASDSWVSAYTLAMLADIPVALIASYARELDDALEWLLAARTPRGGWAYNGAVPDDADSTAWAMIALQAWGREVPDQAREFLLCCRRGPRSFATYPAATAPHRGWSHAAPDVTAVAARALGLRIDPPRLACRPSHLPPAFWWASPVYTTAMLLECDLTEPPSSALRSALARFVPSGPFERALLLRSCLRLDIRGEDLADALVMSQDRSGLWEPSGRLRLANPETASPWEAIDSGPLFADKRGLFTTTTVLSALARFVVDEMAVRSNLSDAPAPMWPPWLPRALRHGPNERSARPAAAGEERAPA